MSHDDNSAAINPLHRAKVCETRQAVVQLIGLEVADLRLVIAPGRHVSAIDRQALTAAEEHERHVAVAGERLTDRNGVCDRLLSGSMVEQHRGKRPITSWLPKQAAQRDSTTADNHRVLRGGAKRDADGKHSGGSHVTCEPASVPVSHR
jgi:hypothetical protein